MDPGAGPARFLTAAGRRWPQARLVGLETDPLAALIGRATLAAAGMADRAVIQIADYRSAPLPAVPGLTLVGTGWLRARLSASDVTLLPCREPQTSTGRAWPG